MRSLTSSLIGVAHLRSALTACPAPARMTLREKMDRACLETLLELASVLPDRIDGVEALLHQRQESSAAGGAKSGGDASQNEAEMLAALGELILAVSHRLQRGKVRGKVRFDSAVELLSDQTKPCLLACSGAG